MKTTTNKTAVAYYRRSTKSQEGSIQDQRKSVQAYASKHGYKIIREYIDVSAHGNHVGAGRRGRNLSGRFIG